MRTSIDLTSPGKPIRAPEYNKLVDTANMVRGITGNVITGPNSIHIPFTPKFSSLPIQYRAVSALSPTGVTFQVGMVVRIVGAFMPTDSSAQSIGDIEFSLDTMYKDWVAYVVSPDDVSLASKAEGHIGYGIVTKTVKSSASGEIAIAGEVPALVKRGSGVTIQSKCSYALVTPAATPTVMTIYGKLKSGTVPAFRVLYEDTSGTLTDAHWALVKVDMGNEIDDQCITVKNDYASSITDGQPAEITGDEDGYLVVDRPSEDSIPAPRIVFPVGIVGASGDNPYGFARAGNEPIWVAYTGDAPAIGDEVGTTTDSFAFTKGNTGFMCVGVDTGGSKCLVRPFSRRGGGLTFTSFTVSGTPYSKTFTGTTSISDSHFADFALSTPLTVGPTGNALYVRAYYGPLGGVNNTTKNQVSRVDALIEYYLIDDLGGSTLIMGNQGRLFSVSYDAGDDIAVNVQAALGSLNRIARIESATEKTFVSLRVKFTLFASFTGTSDWVSTVTQPTADAFAYANGT